MPNSIDLAANGQRANRPTRRGPARLNPLAVLPIFAKLRGRSVLVAGSGEGAAWKAELLVAAGANVLLVRDGANEPHCEDALELVTRNGTLSEDASTSDTPGTVRIEDRTWAVTDLSGASTQAAPHDTSRADRRPAFALIDTECHAEAASFAALARDCGVLVNAIDKPLHCDVQFGSIVNRSPVIVGISTDGAAPILGQAIRRRIETLLPSSLAQWAEAMRTARARVLSILPERAERRAFFERFADSAQRLPWIAGATNDHEHRESDPILDIAHDIARRNAIQSPDGRSKGYVTLVGAGPGDAELLTLKAVRALQAADVILFDALVSEDVLELARREAKRMLVGKRAGRESCRQEDINALMLKLAGPGPEGGKRVVRLKSGDPMVFGRAGEEIEALHQAGIPHEVVPGITSAQALAASLNVSLTHRERARSVRFVTGHGANGELPANLDWRGLADPSTTLVVYMGARTAPLLVERLAQEGLPPSTPAIASSAIARPQQQNWHGTLEHLADGVQTLDRNEPVLIAIGDGMAHGIERGRVSKAA